MQNLVQFHWRRGRRDDPVNLTYLYWGWEEREWEDGLSSLQEIILCVALLVVSTHLSQRPSWLVWRCPHSAKSTSPRLPRCMQLLFPSSLARTEQGEQPPARWGVHTPASPATLSLFLHRYMCWAQWISSSESRSLPFPCCFPVCESLECRSNQSRKITLWKCLGSPPSYSCQSSPTIACLWQLCHSGFLYIRLQLWAVTSYLSFGNLCYPPTVSASQTPEEQRGEEPVLIFSCHNSLPSLKQVPGQSPAAAPMSIPCWTTSVLPSGTESGSLSTILGKKKWKTGRWKKTSIIGWMRQ